MVLIALLLVALVCLALGLILASPYWLVGSLAASAVAAFLLWRVRGQAPAAPRKAAGAPPAEPPAAPAAAQATAAPGAATGDAGWVIDGRPDFHRAGWEGLRDGEPEEIPRDQAKEDGFRPCTDCDPEAVP